MCSYIPHTSAPLNNLHCFPSSCLVRAVSRFECNKLCVTLQHFVCWHKNDIFLSISRLNTRSFQKGMARNIAKTWIPKRSVQAESASLHGLVLYRCMWCALSTVERETKVAGADRVARLCWDGRLRVRTEGLLTKYTTDSHLALRASQNKHVGNTSMSKQCISSYAPWRTWLGLCGSSRPQTPKWISVLSLLLIFLSKGSTPWLEMLSAWRMARSTVQSRVEEGVESHTCCVK